MSQTETQLDSAKLNVEDFAKKASAKVELDIDDAPFLVEDEPPPPPAKLESTPQKDAAAAEDAAQAAALRKRKRLIAAGVGLLVLIIVLAAAWFFALREVPAPEAPQGGVTVIVVPSPEKISGPTVYGVDFAPFLVPQHDAAGRVRFLRVHFSSETIEEKLAKEITEKVLVLRDAVYYYLRNKSHEFMLNPANLPGIKQDVIDILNGYLVQGKLEDLFIENLLMK